MNRDRMRLLLTPARNGRSMPLINADAISFNLNFRFLPPISMLFLFFFSFMLLSVPFLRLRCLLRLITDFLFLFPSTSFGINYDTKLEASTEHCRGFTYLLYWRFHQMPMQGRTSNKLPCSGSGLKLAPVVDDLSHLYMYSICRGSSFLSLVG